MHITTRRLRGAVAVAGIAAVVGLTACSPGGSPEPSSGADENTTFTPEATGEVEKITWNVFQGEPQTIDPYRSADYTPNMITSNMCQNLLVQTPEFEIKPNLATSSSNPDPLTWVYDLRDDVTRMLAAQEAVFGGGRGPSVDSALAELARGDSESWIAEVDGQVVCGGRLTVVPGTEFAGIWGGSTLPEFRGRGIYRALVAARARAALARGVRYLHSDCTDMSRPILERSGLRAVTTTTPYVWTR